jgi:hypothetical protein
MSTRIRVIDGSASFVPTEEMRERVQQAVACGLDEYEVALVLGIEPYALRLHFRDDIEHGTRIVSAKVGAQLLKNAMNGDVRAQQFWLQTRGKWHASKGPQTGDKDDVPEVAERQALVDSIMTLVRTAREEGAASATRASNVPNEKTMT